MSANDRRLARRLVVGAGLAVFGVIVASAFIRHAQVAHPVATEVARILHRIGATSALLVIVMVPFMLLRGETMRGERRLAHVALVIVIALALLGVATPGSKSTLVAVGNMAGGFVLLATSWRWRPARSRGLRLRSPRRSRTTRRPRWPWPGSPRPTSGERALTLAAPARRFAP